MQQVDELANNIRLPRIRSSDLLGAVSTDENSQSVIFGEPQQISVTNPGASSGSKQAQLLINEQGGMVDGRNELVKFFDLNDGHASSQFDFPLSQMFLSDTCTLQSATN